MRSVIVNSVRERIETGRGLAAFEARLILAAALR
jgi:hypothetical protein